MNRKLRPRKHDGQTDPSYRVLILDSDEGGREMTRGLLKLALQGAVEIEEAESLNAGLAKLKSDQPDCLMLDSDLPGHRIDEALATIAREFDGHLPCPVIVLNGSDDAAEASQVLAAGAHDRVAKQWLSPPFLRRVLENAVERFQMERRARQQKEELAALNARLQLASQAAQMGHWTYDLVSGGGQIDELGAKLCDRTPEELLRDGMEHVHPKDRPLIKAAFERAISGERYHCEFRSVRRDGSVHWLAGMGDVLKNDQGEPIGFTGVTWDIDERKRQERRRMQMLDSVAALTLLLEPKGTISEANKVALDQFSVKIEQIRGEHILKCGWWPAQGGAKDALEESLERARSGEACQAELAYLTSPETHTRVLDVQFSPQIDEGGSVTAIVMSGIDVTARINSASEIRQALDKKQQSEAFNRALMEGSSDCVKVLDFEGRLRHINGPGLCAMEIDDFGPICGEHWEQFWPEETKNLVRESVLRAQRGKNTTFQAFCPTAKGTAKWWDISVSPVRDAEGQIVNILSVSRDTTQRKLAQDLVQRSERELRTITANVPDVITRYDRYCRLIFVNEAITKATGLLPQEFLGKTSRELNIGITLPEKLCEEGERKIEQTFLTGKPQSYNFDLELPEGQRYYEARLVPELGIDGAVESVLAVTRDVTERQTLETELRESKAAAEQANQAKDHFLAVLSHELRTPLTPALAAVTELTQSKELPKSVLDDLHMIRRNIELEARIMDDLLDLTRVSRGKLLLNLRPVDLAQKIEQVAAMVLAEAKGKKVELVVENTANQMHVNADAARLQQVLWNLLKNAVKFTSPGGSIWLRTRNRMRDGVTTVVVEVKDTGVGIDPSVLPNIFDAFEQGGPITTRQFGGLGLGLAISKVLVDLLDGELRASSEGRGKGAIFELELRTINQEEPQDQTAAPQISATGRRVLLVEDHEDTRAITARLLESRGLNLRTADTVASAMRTLNAEQFDVIVSDLGLPDGSGHDLLRQARAAGVGTPAIVLSGFGHPRDIDESRSAGFGFHLTKPIDIDQLVEAIIGSLDTSLATRN